MKKGKRGSGRRTQGTRTKKRVQRALKKVIRHVTPSADTIPPTTSKAAVTDGEGKGIRHRDSRNAVETLVTPGGRVVGKYASATIFDPLAYKLARQQAQQQPLSEAPAAIAAAVNRLDVPHACDAGDDKTLHQLAQLAGLRVAQLCHRRTAFVPTEERLRNCPYMNGREVELPAGRQWCLLCPYWDDHPRETPF